MRRPALRLPRRTARLRLTLLYSGMFLLLGTVVVVIIFTFTSAGSAVRVSVSTSRPLRPGEVGGLPGEAGRPPATLVLPEVSHLQHTADISRLLTASWLVLVITALASVVLGWFLAGRVLRPLVQMTDAARNISAHNLGERLALKGPDDEFRRLGDTLDDLLARLQAAFEAQRRFAANASHELRTPLTVDRTLLQVALADPDAGGAQLRAICEELLASGREQERLLDALLTLADSERGVEQREPVDLAAVARRVLEASGADAAKASLQAAPVSGDPALLERLVRNLVDNATQYNDERGVLEVSTDSDAEESRITVSNTGAVVPASAVGRLFEPFQRLAIGRPAEADGHHGLGLSIVRAIAVAHGGRVEARPREGGGLTVTVGFPRESGAG